MRKQKFSINHIADFLPVRHISNVMFDDFLTTYACIGPRYYVISEMSSIDHRRAFREFYDSIREPSIIFLAKDYQGCFDFMHNAETFGKSLYRMVRDIDLYTVPPRIFNAHGMKVFDKLSIKDNQRIEPTEQLEIELEKSYGLKDWILYQELRNGENNENL